MKRKGLVALLLVFTFFLLNSTGYAKEGGHQGTLFYGNNIYDLAVENLALDDYLGTYAVGTGPAHPVTVQTGARQNILYGGAGQSPWSSYLTVHSYTSGTDYLNNRHLSGQGIVQLAPYGAVETLDGTTTRTTWDVGAGAPDQMTITQLVGVSGTQLNDSQTTITTKVVNSGTTYLSIGMRYLWDWQIGGDDGPTFSAINPNGTTWSTEQTFDHPQFSAYRMASNSGSPTFAVEGTVTSPLWAQAVDVLKFASWPDAAYQPFDYTTAGRDVSSDSAVLYYWGPDSGSAITLPPGSSIQVSESISRYRLPAVVVIPGIGEGCYDSNPDDGMDVFREDLEAAMGLSSDRVVCCDYDSTKGVVEGVSHLGLCIDGLRYSLGLEPDEPVHLVGHSMGGLVARYYYEAKDEHGNLLFYNPARDGPIGSINMVGTPNNGVHLAWAHEFMCSISIWTPWGDLHWCPVEEYRQPIADCAPGSDVLKGINPNFTLPVMPEYWAYAGAHSTGVGVTEGYPNDCIVSVSSVSGPHDVFSSKEYTYPDLTHGANPEAARVGCIPPTLTNDSGVALDIANTIEQVSGTSALQEMSQLSGPDPSESSAAFAIGADYVAPSETTTHVFTVPAGMPDTSFVVYWLSADESDLSVTLYRPNGQPVSPSDPDVLGEVNVGGDDMFGMSAHGLKMSAPAAGDWVVSVDGMSTPDQGQAYLTELALDSQVTLAAGPTQPALVEGGSQIITATMFDNNTAIAPTSISATVFTPEGDEKPLALVDDGTGGDRTSGDLVYSGTFPATDTCGRYGVLVTATANTSEGTVTREQATYFESHVPGNTTGNPCLAPGSVGGVAEPPDVAGSASNSSSPPYAALAGAAGGAVLLLMAGGWYARRRWQR